MKYRLLTCLSLSALLCAAQRDPEFPAGTVLYVSARQGINTSFDVTPDFYVGGLGMTPQITLVPGHLRGGVTGELMYTDKAVRALAGPRVSIKLKTFSAGPLGSLFNLQLQLEHLWGTKKERLAGGALALEFFQLLEFQVAAHRDYHLERWWFRAGWGWNLLQKRKRSPTGTDPMSNN